MSEFNKILNFRKYDRFPLTLGEVNLQGEIIEKKSVGFAFLKPGSKMFRLKIWAFPQVSYFLTQDETLDLDQYQVLAVEEYETALGETKTNWNQVGEGQLVGNFIRIRIQFFAEDIYLCLFPLTPEAKGELIAI